MSIQSKMVTLMLLAIFGAFAVVAAQAQDYDVVIRSGRVMDPETQYDDIANVGIKDGIIALITKEKITGQKAIDATGRVVAPGFIDIHAHGQNIGDYRMQAMQGVTTMLELESGVLPIAEWYAKQTQ
jgi:N-acyl-D-glutamate deacylase